MTDPAQTARERNLSPAAPQWIRMIQHWTFSLCLYDLMFVLFWLEALVTSLRGQVQAMREEAVLKAIIGIYTSPAESPAWMSHRLPDPPAFTIWFEPSDLPVADVMDAHRGWRTLDP